MRMGFPMGMEIPWESHGNGNKTQKSEWGWERMGITCTPMEIHSYGNISLIAATDIC